MIKLLDSDIIEAGDEFRCVFKDDYEFFTPFENQKELDWCIVHQGMIGKSVKEYTDKRKSRIYSFRRPSNSVCIITKYIFNKFLKPTFNVAMDLLMFDLNVNDSNGPIHVKTTKLYKILPKSIAKEIHEFCKMTGQYIPPTNQKRHTIDLDTKTAKDFKIKLSESELNAYNRDPYAEYAAYRYNVPYEEVMKGRDILDSLYNKAKKEYFEILYGNNTQQLVADSTLYKMLVSGESVTFKKIGTLLAILVEKNFIKKSETVIIYAQDLKSDIKTSIERLLRKVRS